MNSLLKSIYLPFCLLLLAVAIYSKYLELRKDDNWGTLKSFAVGN